MAKVTERIYTIPLKSEWMKVPRNRRSKRAVAAIQQFLEKHLHVSDVKVSQMVNDVIWTRGIEKPPARIRIKASIDEKGVATARMPEEAVLKDAMGKKKKTKSEEKPKDVKPEENVEASKSEGKLEGKAEEKPKSEGKDKTASQKVEK